jgi:hypothetical protein
VAEHDENIFDMVRTNTARIEDVYKLLRGDEWQTPGMIAILREVQNKQRTLERKVNLLLSVTVFLLVLSLVLSVLLITHMGVGL